MRVVLAFLIAAASIATVTGSAESADVRKSARTLKGKPPYSYAYGYRAPKYTEDEADCVRADSVDPTQQYDMPCWARWALSPKKLRR